MRKYKMHIDGKEARELHGDLNVNDIEVLSKEYKAKFTGIIFRTYHRWGMVKETIYNFERLKE